jgi:hypothetical protein
MTRRGPLITLGAVLVLAVIFLWANTLVAKPASTAVPTPAPWTPAGAAPQVLYAGRSSGDQVTVAITVTGRQAAAELNAGLASQVSLRGSVNGSQVTLTGQNGAVLTASLSGLAMFGMVTPDAGVSLPFSAGLSPRPAGVYQARITVDGLATRIGWAVLPDGTQLGVAAAGATRYAAPPLDLSDNRFTLGGTSFRASPVAGDQTVVSP